VGEEKKIFVVLTEATLAVYGLLRCDVVQYSKSMPEKVSDDPVLPFSD
jgi:hypothetical protein